MAETSAATTRNMAETSAAATRNITGGEGSYTQSSTFTVVPVNGSDESAPETSGFSSEYKAFLHRIFWNGGSAFDAWLNASSFQVSQVLLNLPYTFAQMGMVSGIVFQLFYGFMGCWASFIMTSLYVTYTEKVNKTPSSSRSRETKNHVVQLYEVLDALVGGWAKALTLVLYFCGLTSAATIQIVSCASSAYYINDRLDKRTWTLVLGPALFLVILIPTPRNYRMWSFLGIVMTSYVAWYLTIASAVHGQEPEVKHTGPHSLQNFFTGTSNILYTFGGHGLTVEIAGSMWEPKKFKLVYLYAVLYVFTLTLPSAITVYWAFGDQLLHNANAFAVLSRTKYRDAAVVLLILHQFFEFGLVALPICLMFEKMLGIHHKQNYLFKVAARVPVFLFMWFWALLLPFFGPIDSINGSFFTTLGVYFVPCLAHMIVYRSATTRKFSSEQPPFWLGGSWVGVYSINLGVMIWVAVVGVGFGGWATISNLKGLVDEFGVFSKCYQCGPSR